MEIIERLESFLSKAAPSQVTEHSSVRVDLGSEWANGVDPKDTEHVIDAYVSTNDGRYQMTVGTLLSLAGSLTMGKDVIFSSPSYLIEPLLNHWLTTLPDEDGPSFTIDENGVATAVVRPAGELPAYPATYARSIYDLLEKLSESTVTVHPWVRSDFRGTHVLFVVEKLEAVVEEDVWHGGVGFTMSSAGMLVPSIYPVLVRSGDNALVYPSNLDFRYKRTKHGYGVENTLAWVEDSVGILYTVLERELRVFKWLAKHDTSQHAGHIISDVLKEVGLPRVVKAEVIEASVENDDDSGYGLLCDILSTQHFDEEDTALTEKIGRAAGKLWTVLDNRCDECHQMYH